MQKKKLYKVINSIIISFILVNSVLFAGLHQFLFLPAKAAVGNDKQFTDIVEAVPNTEYRSNNITLTNAATVTVSGGTNTAIIKNLANTGLSTTSLVAGDLLSIFTRTPNTVNTTTTIAIQINTTTTTWVLKTVAADVITAATGNISGYTKGSAGVNNSGAATYSIPIEVSPGTAGVQPKLSLNYNSQNNNGLLGIGWNLSGLSAITRCPMTLAQDNDIDSIDFDANDKFCLEGERLQLYSGTYGAHDAEYRTEHESFSRIRSYTPQNGAPTSFKVWTKSGQIMDYGATLDSRIEAVNQNYVHTWALNRIEDTAGNYIIISYYEDTSIGEFVPTEIKYTGNSKTGQQPFARVFLTYVDKPVVEQDPQYTAGSRATSKRRISKIQSLFKGSSSTETIVREYRLGYTDSGSVSNIYNETIKTHLTSIQECGLNASQCFTPTTFTWSALTNNNFNFNGTGSSANWAGTSVGLSGTRAGDFNGDGKTDLISAATGSGAGYWNICLSTGTTFNCAVWQSIDTTIDNLWIGDFNGDGKSDMLKYANTDPNNAAGLWRIGFSTGSGFTKSDLLTAHQGGPGNNVLGDFNGDGRTDITGFMGSNSSWHMALSTGNGFESTNLSGEGGKWIAHNGGTTYNSVGDFNGDGMSDLATSNGAGLWNVCLSTGKRSINNGFNCSNWTGHQGNISNNNFTGDFNGDGKTDVLAFTGTGNVWEECLSTGINFSCAQYPAHAGGNNNNITGDFNGDGKTDIAGYSEANQQWHVCLSRNPGFTCPTFWSGHQGGTGNNITADFNGDGRSDIAGYRTDTNNNLWHVSMPGGITADLIESATNGNGFTTKFTYKPLTDNSIYIKDNDAVYPRFDFQGPLYVVTEVDNSNGIGGFIRSSYRYGGAEINLRGRGFRGFRWIVEYDNAKNIRTYTAYEQSHVYASMVVGQERRTISTNALIQSTGNVLQYKPTLNAAGQPIAYFASIIETNNTDYEPATGGTSIVSSSIKYKYDDYGNTTEINSGFSDGNSTVTTNVYENDATDWILGRLTRSTVTKSLTGQPAVTKVSAFEYDAATGMLTKEIIEPDQTQFTQTKIYSRDTFGNITSNTISGTGVTARTSSTEYDSFGRYTVKESNALGHITQFSINQSTGLIQSSTDANTLVTTSVYDGFGRLISSTNPDTTSAKTAYLTCTSSTGCPVNAKYFIQSVASGVPYQIAYYDSLDRVVRTETIGFSGQKIYSDTVYDATGHVQKKSLPYFSGGTPEWTTYTYDLIQRVNTETAPGNRTISYSYNGFATTATNPKSQTTTQIKNSLGQLVKSIDSQNNFNQFVYDSAGNTIKSIDASGNIATITYDIRGNKITHSDPSLGLTSYTYNAFGELTSQKNARNQTITYTYDALGRVLRKIEPEGTTDYTYDSRAYSKGKLTGISRSDGYRKHILYDAFSRSREIIEKIEGQTYSVANTYDIKGRVNTTTYPSSFTTINVYNTNNYQSEVRGLANNNLFWQAQTTNAFGLVEKELLGNNLLTIRTFDPQTASLKTQQTGTSANPTSAQNAIYTYDTIGNLTERKDVLRGVGETFAYDTLNRVTQSTINTGTAVSVSYNASGNILSKSDVGTYTYGSTNPYAVTSVSGTINATYGYGITGNRTSGPSETIDYSSFNKPNSIIKNGKTVNFSYSPEYYKTVQSVSDGTATTKTVYIQGIYEKETSGSSTDFIHYIYASGRLVSIYTRSQTGTQTVNFVLTDHLGSPSVITGDTGLILEVLSFDPWGKRRNTNFTPSNSITSSTTKGYTGHDQIDAVGFVDMKGRTYDPVLGRFISADPFVQSPANTQSFNRYTYVSNNPLNLTDPSGYFSFGDIGEFFGDLVDSVVDFVSDNYIAIVSVAIGIITGPMFFGLANVVGSGAGFGFGAAFSGALLSGQGFGDALVAGIKGGVIGGITAYISSGIGDIYLHEANPGNVIQKAFAHGVVGGVSNVAQGGKFEHGFFSSVASNVLAIQVSDIKGFTGEVIARTATAAVIGGTIAELTGGNFVNGAVTSAFQRLYNEEVSILTVRDTSLVTYGSHSAVYVGGGSESVLYDPAGSYPGISGEPRGTGDALFGEDANINSFVKYHESHGSTVDIQTFTVTQDQAATIINNIDSLGGRMPFMCATSVSSAINNVGPFKNIEASTPGGLYDNLKGLKK